MIPDRNEAVKVTSTITGDKIDMSFDQNSLVHIMSILTDLYSDPELAVIREYSTNALDSHREAGETRPIEISLPTDLAPFFKIKDYGVGLSVDDIHNIYSKYGASTKRETNEQTGMLGLGCKSALTYTSQFTLVAVKNGTKVTVSISRNEEGAGSMTVVDTHATDEPTGVEVVIPVKRGNEFESKCQDFFQFWEPGTVTINGETPEPVDGMEVSDKFTVVSPVKRTYSVTPAKSYLVMGNVPYPLDDASMFGLKGGYGIVARVEIGAVNFTPNREALHYTPRTKSAIDDLATEFVAACEGAIQRFIDQCSTHHEALCALVDYRNVLPVEDDGGTYTYKGEDIPETYEVDEGVILNAHPRALSHHSKLDTLVCGVLRDVLWIHGWERKSFTAGQRKKINKWIGQNISDKANEFPRRIVLTKEKPDDLLKWVPDDRKVDWETINAIKIERVMGTRGPRIPGSYDIYVEGSGYQYGVPGDDIDTSKPLFYTTGGKWSEHPYRSILGEEYEGCTIVPLPSNRVPKFCRLFPMAKPAHDEAVSLYEKWKNSLSDSDKMILGICSDRQLEQRLWELDPKKIDDPDLSRAISAIKGDTKTDVDQLKTMWSRFSSVTERQYTPDNWPDPSEKYAILQFLSAYILRQIGDEIYAYLNAVYESTT